jgi:hypothetical protein
MKDIGIVRKEGGGGGSEYHRQGLILLGSRVIHRCLEVCSGTHQAPVHVPRAAVLVLREEGRRQLQGPSEPAVQRRAGRQFHDTRDLDDGGDENKDGGREEVIPVGVEFEVVCRELPQANIVDLPGGGAPNAGFQRWLFIY